MVENLPEVGNPSSHKVWPGHRACAVGLVPLIEVALVVVVVMVAFVVVVMVMLVVLLVVVVLVVVTGGSSSGRNGINPKTLVPLTWP